MWARCSHNELIICDAHKVSYNKRTHPSIHSFIQPYTEQTHIHTGTYSNLNWWQWILVGREKRFQTRYSVLSNVHKHKISKALHVAHSIKKKTPMMRWPQSYKTKSITITTATKMWYKIKQKQRVWERERERARKRNVYHKTKWKRMCVLGLEYEEIKHHYNNLW